MKNRFNQLLVATISYSFLFYNQNAGINFLLFTCVLIGLFVVNNTSLLVSKKWLFSSILNLISATSVFIISSDLSILAYILSLLVLAAVSYNVKTSGLTAFLFGIYSLLSSFVFIIINTITWFFLKEKQVESNRNYRGYATIIVVLLCIMFLGMYQNSNPIFAENTKWINLDFISFRWFAFTIGGFIIMFGIIYQRTIKQIEQWDNDLKLENPSMTEEQSGNKQYDAERFSGMLLFIVLNAMLLLLNIGDFKTIYLNGTLPEGATLSEFVHEGVDYMILSITIATNLIMYLYRKEFGWIKNNKALLMLVYAWIIQNIVMISSTMVRNQLYISEYNLTHKRIGVYVWLILAVIGLLIIFIKLLKKRSNWYIVRVNFWAFLFVLVGASTVNWDNLITNYNLKNKPLDQVDLYYLFSLSDANIKQLVDVTHTSEFKELTKPEKKYTADSSSVFFNNNYHKMLSEKIYSYLVDRADSWKSFDMREHTNLKAIYPNKQ